MPQTSPISKQFDNNYNQLPSTNLVTQVFAFDIDDTLIQDKSFRAPNGPIFDKDEMAKIMTQMITAINNGHQVWIVTANWTYKKEILEKLFVLDSNNLLNKIKFFNAHDIGAELNIPTEKLWLIHEEGRKGEFIAKKIANDPTLQNYTVNCVLFDDTQKQIDNCSKYNTDKIKIEGYRVDDFQSQRKERPIPARKLSEELAEQVSKTTLKVKQLSPGIIPFQVDFEKQENGKKVSVSPEEQARIILDEVARLHILGAKKVGITYSANQAQTEKIISTYSKNEWKTGTSGSNQAQVIDHIETLLGTPKYADLQKVYQIIPITTMQYKIGVPMAADDYSVIASLNNANQFIANGGIILGWRNQLTGPGRLAIGGGIASSVQKAEQKTMIEQWVKENLRISPVKEHDNKLPKKLSCLKTFELLDSIKQKPKSPLTDEIIKNLAEIKQICDKDYSNQSYYGNTALNRKMLLDSRIAKLLTPEVLTYLFTNEPMLSTQILRNSSPNGVISLRDAIYNGFSNGLQVIHLMPNNERNYGIKAYEAQKKNFANTLAIAANIGKAAGVEGIESEPEFNPSSLINQFERIVKTVNLLKSQGKSDALLFVPGYSSEEMRSQVSWGYEALCRTINTDLTKETLDSFCEQFLKNPEALLNGSVIHLFYDRAHIEAALEQNTLLQIGGQNYTFQDIFKVMVQKIATNPDVYPVCAKEQFCLRFQLVEADLVKRFNQEHKQEQMPSILPQPIHVKTSITAVETNNDPLKKPDLISQLTKILDSYIVDRSNFSGCNPEYKITFFCIGFGFSKTQKFAAVEALKRALKGEKNDLSIHLPALKNGELGKSIAKFLGKTELFTGKKIKTAAELVEYLNNQASTVTLASKGS